MPPTSRNIWNTSATAVALASVLVSMVSAGAWWMMLSVIGVVYTVFCSTCQAAMAVGHLLASLHAYRRIV